MEINGFGWQRKGLPNKQHETNIKSGKGRSDARDGASELSKRQGRLIGPGLCHLMTDRLSSQMGHTKLSSEMY